MNKELLKYYKSSKATHRKLVSKLFLTDMFYQNVQSLFDDRWSISVTNGRIDVSLKDMNSLTLDKFDKIIAKLSIAFNKQPYMYIGKDRAEATFYLYPRLCDEYNHFRNTSIVLEVSVGNSEKCEFIETTRIVTDLEPTGYCKALQNKKYI